MKKIGLFGGTFDPIHFGHLNLAIHLFEAHHLDRVLFCPVSQSPFKKERSAAGKDHRKEMTRIGIEGFSGFELFLFEMEKGGVSYTVETLRHLREKERFAELFLLLSQESVHSFHRWHHAEEIVSLARPIIGMREGWKGTIPPSPIEKELALGLTPTPLMEISSTSVRERLKKNLYCGHLVPGKVLDYIEQNQLY